MTFIHSQISVAEAATAINALVAFLQITLSASFVVVLMYFMPKTNSALAWSSIVRMLHSSLWPTLLQTDSAASESAGTVGSCISYLITLTTALVAISGVILPLGLKPGPFFPSNHPEVLPTHYIVDASPLALSTTLGRHKFHHGRYCGTPFVPSPCPGNGDNSNTTGYSPLSVEIFNSTPHGPYAMQFRPFYNSAQNPNMSKGIKGTAESFILREDAFVVDGLVVDMTPDHFGIGFWNQSLPHTTHGGSWAQDLLWLEPVTTCVDTNLSADYILSEGPQDIISTFNITDHGGFYGLTRNYLFLDRNGQHPDLAQHAHKGAVLSNYYAMVYLNATRQTSFEGKTYLFDGTLLTSIGNNVGKAARISMNYFNSSASDDIEISCQGFGPGDIANLTNIHVSCGAFLGPPLRTDGGNPSLYDGVTRWSQRIQVCASATRASIQTVTFSTNSTSDLHNIRITHKPTGEDVIWAVEKADMIISRLELLWGRVDSRFESDPSLWIIHGNSLYLPAGSSSYYRRVFTPGQPLAAHATAWADVYNPGMVAPGQGEYDYIGTTNYAVQAKFQTLSQQDPIHGLSRIRNAIWTDIMANNLIGTPTNSTLLVTPNEATIRYDFKFAIPGFLLLSIWIPVFLVAVALLVSRKLKFGFMKKVLDSTSIGRVVLGPSLLRASAQDTYSLLINDAKAETPVQTEPFMRPDVSDTDARGALQNDEWRKSAGATRVTLFLDRASVQ